MAYVAVDMTSLGLVFVDGEEFHVGVTTTDQVNNVLAILSDDGSNGQLRSSENWNGFWGLMLDDWGVDVNFLIGVDICCADLPYSECYRQEYNCGVTYFWKQPDAYGDDYFNMKMSVEGPETLTAVGIALYATPTVGTPDLDGFVWGRTAGFPDLSDVIFSTSIPFGSLAFFPAYNHVVVPGNIVMRSDFHVGWSTGDANPGDVLAGLSDNGSCGTLRSSEWWGVWGTMLADWGVDVNFLIYADMCKDEFSVCYTEAYYCGLAYFWRLPDRYGDIGDYQKISPSGIGCRLEKVRIAMYWASSEAALPLYTYNSEFQAWASDGSGGVCGTFLGGITVTPADYVLFPGWTEVDFTSQNITFDEDIWIGVESFAPDTLTGIRTLSDNGSCGDLRSCENWGGSFFYMLDDWGIDVNFVMEADICCIPPEERACDAKAGEDWVTCGHDFRRTAASNNSTGDAKCKQALAWMHTDPDGFIYGRPIIYDGMVLAPYNSKLQAFDINTAALLWTKTGLPEMGSGFRNTVTAKDGFVYLGGGNGRSFSKVNAYTGATIWSRNVVNAPLNGNTTYTTSVILDCAGTEVVFLATTSGALYALDAATGANYAGWVPNPVMLDGDPQQTLSSNGVDVLYIGTNGAFGNGYGTLYAIDACTGVPIWSLGDGDLYGYDLDGDEAQTDVTEIFQGPIGVDLDGALYVQAAFNTEAVSGAPSAAIYKISAGGTIVWGKPFAFCRYTGPVIDANLVYMTTLRGWTSEPTNATYGYKKTSGAVIWQVDPLFDGMNWIEGALSCEEMAADLLYVGNTDGQFLVINADDGAVEFEYNYVVGSSNRGVGAAIDASHVVFNNRQGDLYVFTNQVDRPRLRVLKYDEFQTVPFFSPPSFIVTYDDVFMNNGCDNLTGSVSASSVAPAAYAWTVNPARIARMQRVADGMVDNSYADMARNLVKRQAVDPSTLDAEFAQSPYAKDSYSNMGAYAPPVWLNGIMVTSFDLAPGEAFSVVYDVNGPLVSRGPQRCYVTIASNDAYFLNGAGDPTVQLGVIGGCLQTDDFIVFGATEQNQAPVFNTGEQGNQNGSALWTFDGETNRYWQGGFFFAAAQHRLAWTTDSWHGADPADWWNSLLPDPNCFDQCAPYITPDPVLLGAISHDGGMTYDDIYGYAAAVAYVDSVINFDCYGTGWDWENVNCPFDNALTLGLRVEQFMYGAIEEAALNNVVIYRHDVTNRNAAPIQVYMGAFHDFDLDGSLNGFDLFRFNAQYSISWGSPCTPAYDFTDGVVYGVGKIPMDVDPMIGVRTMDADQAMWHADNVALDSMYYYMTSQPGQTAQVGIDMNFPCDPGSESSDRDEWASFLGHNYAGFETYSYGTYLFGYAAADVTDDQFFIDLAKLVNQFAGFNRGDINADGLVNLADVVALWNMVNASGPGPLFEHLADVNNDDNVDNGDVLYLANFYFCVGPAPVGAWKLPNICP
jgi:hypothetical protein